MRSRELKSKKDHFLRFLYWNWKEKKACIFGIHSTDLTQYPWPVLYEREEEISLLDCFSIIFLRVSALSTLQERFFT